MPAVIESLNGIPLVTGIVDRPEKSKKESPPYSPEQELLPFGKWVGESIWVPPKENSTELAKSMLNRFGPFVSKERCWKALLKQHRSDFTQVREFELPAASIRLPSGRLFVTVTEQAHFDSIEDPIPNCVRTRLDEFLAGRGKQRGVKVYYLKPLCVEIENQLIFTTQEQISNAITQIQKEVFSEYRRCYLRHRAKRLAIGTVDAGLAIPRSLLKRFFGRKKREIEAYHLKLEFERRQRALQAAQTHCKLRRGGCTFDQMLSLMNPLDRNDVIDHYVSDNELSEIDRKLFLLVSAATLPWFAALSLGIYNLAAASMAISVTLAACDPAFVAEMPGSKGVVLKIGHFDEVDGVMHVEI